MKTLKNNKTLLLTVLLIIIFVAVYKVLFKSDFMIITTDPTSQSVGDEVLTMFNSLQQVNFDSSAFSSPGYLMLTDFSTEIPPQTTGRRNPFDVIGRN